jgi:dTDP-4-amino-4,6-dideoxygalactose transaminase
VIPISDPLIGEPEEKLVLEVLRSGRLVKGPMVEQFEGAVERVAGTRHAIAVNNGTSALIAALMGNDVGPGDEVITSPFTFVATINAVLHAGASARFVDVGDDFTLDPDLLTEAIRPRTRAVMPVHLYGCPAAMHRIEAAVAGTGIVVVEDAAQALGAHLGGRPAGSFGTGCFSFYATKNVTTGEGGAVTTDDDEVAETIRLLRDQGQRAWYGYGAPGFNLRMTELQAALGVAQMARLADIVEARRRNAGLLTEGLAGIEGLLLPVEPTGRFHVYHQYTVRVTPAARRTRNGLRELLGAQGIGCGVYYPRPVFDYDCFRDDPRVIQSPAPNAARLATEVLSLPVHPKLTTADLEKVIEVVHRALA